MGSYQGLRPRNMVPNDQKTDFLFCVFNRLQSGFEDSFLKDSDGGSAHYQIARLSAMVLVLEDDWRVAAR